MSTLDKPRERFEAIVDALTAVVIQSSNLDTGLLTRTAASQSQNLAGLEQELRAMRIPLSNGLVVCAPDFEALAGFAEANALSLEDIQDGVGVDGGSGRVISLACLSKRISDTGALSGLTSLRDLHLSGNQIQDISTLSGLTSLKRLILYENQLQDIFALTGLTSLSSLDLSKNRIQDISALTFLTSLTQLRLSDNQIHDISAFSGLSSLKELVLYRNQIQDISALSGLTSLAHLTMDKPEHEKGSAVSKFDHQIAALRSRNVYVDLI